MAHPENYPLLMKSMKEKGKEEESKRKSGKSEELFLREKSQDDFIKWLIERPEFVLLRGRQNVMTRSEGTGKERDAEGSVRKAYPNVCQLRKRMKRKQNTETGTRMQKEPEDKGKETKQKELRKERNRKETEKNKSKEKFRRKQGKAVSATEPGSTARQRVPAHLNCNKQRCAQNKHDGDWLREWH